MSETRTLWTCPFCPLLCDSLTVRRGAAWEIGGGDCQHAAAGLAGFDSSPSTESPLVDGKPCSLDKAVAAASALLAGSRQPLFGGLGTDVAGARSLYRLACRTGAISDAAGSEAMQHLTRARQDRGGYFTTLAEIRTRADVIVCLGGVAAAQGVRLFERIGFGTEDDDGEALVAHRHVVVVGPTEADAAVLGALRRDGVTVESIGLEGDLFDTVALLATAVAGHANALQPLADRLIAARYAAFIGQCDLLPAQGTLVVEAVHQVVATLNRTTRAGAFWIGGGGGAATVDQVFTWLSGLPLRSRAGPRGLEHEPVCFEAERLAVEGSVDAGLWVSAFDDDGPPASSMPWIVVGRPSLATSKPAVFIPVSTPGIGSTGHLFRTDGGVVLPLSPLYEDTLPTVAQVVDRIVMELR